MTAPTVTEPVCVRCGGPIVHLGGPSWRHVGRPGGNPHPATPDDQTRQQTLGAAA